MPTAAIAALAVSSVVTLLVLAVALVAVVDRVRATTLRLLAVRDDVLPAVEQLRLDAEAARDHATSLREQPLRHRDPGPGDTPEA